jgi:hypothetical protein
VYVLEFLSLKIEIPLKQSAWEILLLTKAQAHYFSKAVSKADSMSYEDEH